MKWNKMALLAVMVIFSISYVYSALSQKKLSNEVKEEQLKKCMEEKKYDCGLISQFHDECFSASYRAEYRIRSYHPDEYLSCIEDKVNHQRGSGENTNISGR